MANYMDHVHETWFTMFAGVRSDAWTRLDLRTVNKIRLLSPGSREDGWVLDLMQDDPDGPILPHVNDPEERNVIRRNLCSIRYPMLDLASMNEDNKLLGYAMGCIAGLLQMSLSDVVSHIDGDHSHLYPWALIAFSLKHLEQLEPQVILHTSRGCVPDPVAWRRFAQLAHDGGWDNATINRHRGTQDFDRHEKRTVLAQLDIPSREVFDPTNKMLRQGRPTWTSIVGQLPRPQKPHSPHSALINPEYIRMAKIRAYVGSEFDKAMAQVVAVEKWPAAVASDHLWENEASARSPSPLLPSLSLFYPSSPSLPSRSSPSLTVAPHRRHLASSRQSEASSYYTDGDGSSKSEACPSVGVSHRSTPLSYEIKDNPFSPPVKGVPEVQTVVESSVSCSDRWHSAGSSAQYPSSSRSGNPSGSNPSATGPQNDLATTLAPGYPVTLRWNGKELLREFVTPEQREAGERDQSTDRLINPDMETKTWSRMNTEEVMIVANKKLPDNRNEIKDALERYQRSKGTGAIERGDLP